MRHFKNPCAKCGKREKCTRICPRLEKVLPLLEHMPQSDLSQIDREIVWSIQSREDELPAAWAAVGRLYFRFGLSHNAI